MYDFLKLEWLAKGTVIYAGNLDQRFLRLQKVQVPDLKLDDAGRTYKVQV
jgi:hypothetical protein